MVKRQVSSKRKASVSPPPIASPNTRSSARQRQSPGSSAKKAKKGKTQTSETMFGKSKKSRPYNGHSSSNNVYEMFVSLVDDPDDPNSVITLEGTNVSALEYFDSQIIS